MQVAAVPISLERVALVEAAMLVSKEQQIQAAALVVIVLLLQEDLVL
jgi:hypothetical protein